MNEEKSIKSNDIVRMNRKNLSVQLKKHDSSLDICAQLFLMSLTLKQQQQHITLLYARNIKLTGIYATTRRYGENREFQI